MAADDVRELLLSTTADASDPSTPLSAPDLRLLIDRLRLRSDRLHASALSFAASHRGALSSALLRAASAAGSSATLESSLDSALAPLASSPDLTDLRILADRLLAARRELAERQEHLAAASTIASLTARLRQARAAASPLDTAAAIAELKPLLIDPERPGRDQDDPIVFGLLRSDWEQLVDELQVRLAKNVEECVEFAPDGGKVVVRATPRVHSSGRHDVELPVALQALEDGGTNQLMGRVWGWNNMYGTKLKKFDGWVLHTANEDGNGGEDDATALSEDHEDGYGGEEDAAAPLEDHGYGGEEDAAAPLEDHDGDQDDRGAVSEDSNDGILPYGHRAVQVLAIRANFPIETIIGYDWHFDRCIYTQLLAEVQEEGMVDLIPIGPGEILMAYASFSLEVYHSTTTTGDEGPSRVSSPIRVGLDVCDQDDCEEYTLIIDGGPGRMLEITYLVIPEAIEANVEVRLKLKDLGSRRHVVYGKI